MVRIQIAGLKFAYSGHKVLKGIDLRPPVGKILTIIGPNGSGKTTLLDCIAGMQKIEGNIKIDGKDIGCYSRDELADLVGYLPQDLSTGGSLTVFETVLLGRYLSLTWKVDDESIELVQYALKLLKLDRFATRRLDDLSGGERQRVYIAQVLVKKSGLLLLDEPTSNLDLKYQFEICELLRKICTEEKTTIIMAVHDLNMASRYSDNVAILKNGRILAEGPPKTVFTTQMIKRAYGVNSRIIDDAGRPLIIPTGACDYQNSTAGDEI